MGKEHIPKNKPVLFLPNHQSALLDVLLIATDCKRKPFFLTRSDVFSNSFLNRIFTYFRMLPIYRIRDGRNTLAKNNAIFDACAAILGRNKAIVMFPEANHNLKRRVRPLSKGFTRVIERSLKKYPDLDIQIVPVGLNYQHPKRFPDEVAVYYGKAISVKEIYNEIDDDKVIVEVLKEKVAEQLERLTTHIEDIENYDQIANRLEALRVDFLKPEEVNRIIAETSIDDIQKNPKHKVFNNSNLWHRFFRMINMPVFFFWRNLVLPKIQEG